MSIEKMYCSESRKSLSQQLLFEGSLLWIHFASALYYFYYNIFIIFIEATSLIIHEVAFETCIFLLCFCYSWKDKPLLVFDLFISEYLDQIPPWEEMKEAFSVKLQTENCCFCLKWKLNKAQAAQRRNTMQSLSILIKISGSVFFCILERIQAKRAVGKKVFFFFKYSWGIWEAAQSQ